MKRLRLLSLVLVMICAISLSGCMHGGRTHEGTFSRELSVSGTTTLDLQSGAGGVTVRPGADNKVSIFARIRARGILVGMSGEEKVKRIQDNPPISQEGNTIRVGRINDFELHKNVLIDYEITLPADSQVTIVTGAGNVNVRGVKGAVRATTGAGGIDCQDLSDDVRLETGAGNIIAHGIRGRLDASSGAGSIKASGDPKKDWRLNVGAGSIQIQVPGNASFELDASTGFGKINLSSDIGIKNSSKTATQLRGTVGNGGPALHVNNGAGSIDISRGAGTN